MNDFKIKYPFDQYTRSTYIANFVQRLAKDLKLNKPKVLDLGGYRGKMDEFFGDNVDLYVMDIFDIDEERYIKGDARNIQSEDNSYDFVFMSDVLEHIEESDRESAIKEAVRVSKYGTILCFPYYQEKTAQYEKTLNNIYSYLSNNSHPWLGEHIENGLPLLQNITNTLNSIPNINYLEFTSNDIDIWFNSILLNFLIFEEKFPPNFIFDIYEYYNNNIKDIDICEDGYRAFFCIWKHDYKYTIKDFTKLENTLTKKKKEEVMDAFKTIISNYFTKQYSDKIPDIYQSILKDSYYNILSESIMSHSYLYKRLYEANVQLNYENKSLQEKLNEELNVQQENSVLNKYKSKLKVIFNRSKKIYTKQGRRRFVIKLYKASKILYDEGPIGFLKKMRRYIKNMDTPKPDEVINEPINSKISVKNLISSRFMGIKKIDTVYSIRKNLRINLVIPALTEDSLFGGIMTALTFSTLLANDLNAGLRIICTEGKINDISSYFSFIKTFNLPLPKEVEIYEGASRFSGDQYYKLEISESDIFIATFWSTSYISHLCNLKKKFIYLIQEFEPIFYINGDEQTLVKDSYFFDDIIPVVNSKVLFDYFIKYEYSNIKENGLYFEPAFPKGIFKPNSNSFEKKDKYKLFFYSRPNAPRNLFYRGIQLIDKALSLNIIDTNIWEIYLVGQDIPDLIFSNNTSPTIVDKMNLPDYANFISTIDLGISLMEAPHPSYPPLDLLCSGAVVLTNNYDVKQNLNYSKNLILADTNINSLMVGLESAIRLAKNNKKRKQNYDDNKISRDWETSFSPIIKELSKRISEGAI